MNQDGPSLFKQEQSAPFVPWSVTSQAAAEAIEPAKGTLQRVVLEWFRHRGEQGGTDEEGIHETGIAASTWRPRRIELCRDGFVINSGEERKTLSGRQATVWKVK